MSEQLDADTQRNLELEIARRIDPEFSKKFSKNLELLARLADSRIGSACIVGAAARGGSA